jgi:hypothetical protein
MVCQLMRVPVAAKGIGLQVLLARALQLVAAREARRRVCLSLWSGSAGVRQQKCALQVSGSAISAGGCGVLSICARGLAAACRPLSGQEGAEVAPHCYSCSTMYVYTWSTRAHTHVYITVMLLQPPPWAGRCSAASLLALKRARGNKNITKGRAADQPTSEGEFGKGTVQSHLQVANWPTPIALGRKWRRSWIAAGQ